MTNPITPPPDLIQEWIDEPQHLSEDWIGKRMNMVSMNELKFREIIDKASQYGADQELEACCKWLPKLPPWSADDLRRHRRPKPPSLRKQAYDALDTYIYGEPDPKDKERTYNTIRRALEQLDD